MECGSPLRISFTVIRHDRGLQDVERSAVIAHFIINLNYKASIATPWQTVYPGKISSISGLITRGGSRLFQLRKDISHNRLHMYSTSISKDEEKSSDLGKTTTTDLRN